MQTRRRPQAPHGLVQSAHRARRRGLGRAASDMLQRVLADGSPFIFTMGDRAGFTSHDWEIGIFARRLRRRHAHLGVRLVLAQLAACGRALASGSSSATPRTARWPTSGSRTSSCRSGAVAVRHARHRHRAHRAEGHARAPPDRTDQTAYVGGGVRYYLTRRFFVRAEYQSHYGVHEPQRQREGGRMETRIRILLLSAACSALLTGCASLRNWSRPRRSREASRPQEQADAAGRQRRCRTQAPPRVIEPEVARRKIKVPKIDTENFEIGGGVRRPVHRGLRHQPGLRRDRRLSRDRRLLLPGRSGPLHGRQDELRDARRQHRSCLPEMRGNSRITTSPSATTSCLARSFSVATSP